MVGRPTEPPRSITVTFDREQTNAIFRVMEHENFSTMADAIRFLVTVALSSNPIDGHIEAQKRQAFNEIRTWALQEAQTFAKDLQRKVHIAIRSGGVTPMIGPCRLCNHRHTGEMCTCGCPGE